MHSFSYEYVNPATNMCLDIRGASSADFNPLWTCNQTNAQLWQWDFERRF